MLAKYAPIKFVALATPYFIAVPIAIFLVNIVNVSIRDMSVLTVFGLILGIFYLAIAYTGAKRKTALLKFIILATSLPLAIIMRFIVQIAVKYDSIMIIIWVFLFAIIVACTQEISKIMKVS